MEGMCVPVCGGWKGESDVDCKGEKAVTSIRKKDLKP